MERRRPGFRFRPVGDCLSSTGIGTHVDTMARSPIRGREAQTSRERMHVGRRASGIGAHVEERGDERCVRRSHRGRAGRSPQPVGGQAPGRRRRAGDPDRAARRKSGTLVRPLRRRQGRSRPLPRLLVVQHRQAERRPRHQPPAGPGSAPATAGPRGHLPRKHAAGNAASVWPRLRLRLEPPCAHLHVADRLRSGRPVARLPDERRRPPGPRRPHGEHRLLRSDSHARSAGRVTRRGTWAASSRCTASPWRSSIG